MSRLSDTRPQPLSSQHLLNRGQTFDEDSASGLALVTTPS